MAHSSSVEVHETVDRLTEQSNIDALLVGSTKDCDSNENISPVEQFEDAITVADDGVHDDIDGRFSPTAKHEAQVKVPTQFMRPLLTAKRKLSFNQLPKSPSASYGLCQDVTESEPADTRLIGDQGKQISTNEHSDSTILRSDSEMESVKRSSHIQVQSSYLPSSSKTVASAMAVSPLTKAFRAFHMHQSQPSLEMHHPYSLSTSSHPQPVLIPSFSFPCLLTPHPIAQPFTLEPPPLGKVSKPPIAVTSQEYPFLSITSNSTRNSDLAVQQSGVQMRQLSSSVRVSTCSKSNTVYTTPTSSRTCSTSSTTSHLTPPSHTKSSSLTGSVAKWHKHLSSGTRAMKSNMKNNQSSSNLKQVLMQPCPLQQKAETSFHCPSRIHCDNCGHEINLKTYLQNLQMQRNRKTFSNATSSIPIQDNKTTVPAKPSVPEAGSTVFDLEAVCDVGSIHPNLSLSFAGERQRQQGEALIGQTCGRQSFGPTPRMISGIATLLDKDGLYNLKSTNNKSMLSKTLHTVLSDVERCSIVSSYFPHSDEFTKSFVPVFSGAGSAQGQEDYLAECWSKLDSLDVDELLQLVEATSDLRYCSVPNQNICYGEAGTQSLREDENRTGQQVESFQTANHILTKDAGCSIPRGESGVYDLKDDMSKVDKNSKGLDKMTSDTVMISTNGSLKSDYADSSDGSKTEGPSRRLLRSGARQRQICKKRPRKKKTNGNKRSK